MIKLKSILFYYNILFIFCLLTIGVFTRSILNLPALLIVLVPLVLYFWGYLVINAKKNKNPQNYFFWVFVGLLLAFNCLSTFLLFVVNLFFARSIIDILISLLYLPFPVYFFLTIFHWYKKVQQNNLAQKKIIETKEVSIGHPMKMDLDRRRFLKMLSGTGISVFILSLINPKQAGAAFFGSVPGPGTVSIKDASGVKINPAEKQVTDGYKISKVDDISSDTYAYYGFVHSTGAWYIQRETLSGANTGDYQYYKGSTSFSTNWTGRDGFVYDDFENVF